MVDWIELERWAEVVFPGYVFLPWKVVQSMTLNVPYITEYHSYLTTHITLPLSHHLILLIIKTSSKIKMILPQHPRSLSAI